MKKMIIGLFLLLPACSWAQGFEIGVGGGVSINSRPTNNEYYKGNEITPNYAASLELLFNMPGHWQIGLEGNAFEMSRKSPSDTYAPLYSKDANSKGEKMVFGSPTTTAVFVVNKKLGKGKSGFYVGAVAGGAFSLTSNAKNPPSGVYYIAPNGGYGLVYGPHAGYTYKITDNFGINAQISALVIDQDYTSTAPHVGPMLTNLHYRIIAYPLTVGIRYCFTHHDLAGQERRDGDDDK